MHGENDMGEVERDGWNGDGVRWMREWGGGWDQMVWDRMDGVDG